MIHKLMVLLTVFAMQACVVYETPSYVSPSVVPSGAVVESQGIYYQEVIISGSVYRTYYRWHPRYRCYIYSHKLRIR